MVDVSNPQKHDNGRHQTQQQLRNIKESWISKSCGLPTWIIITAVLCLVFWASNLLFAIAVDTDTRGSFGDTFGVVNSIFSAFALLGVAWGISQQRQQLSQTREELEVVKDGREETRRIFKDQQANLQQERFETTFFQLFSAFQNLTSSLTVKDGTDVLGKDVFSVYLRSLNSRYKFNIDQVYDAELENIDDVKDLEHFPNNFLLANMSILQHTYSDFFKVFGSDIGRYFRSLYTIIKYVDDSLIEDEKNIFTVSSFGHN